MTSVIVPTTAEPLNASMLAELLTVTRIDSHWRHDPRLDVGSALCARIRGAWGRRLSALAEDDQEAAAAWGTFFPDKSEGDTAFGAAPPYRIAASVQQDGDLQVSLKLIGFSGRWRRVAFDSLIEALSTYPGLRLAFGNPLMANLKLLDATWTRTEGVAVPVQPTALVLDFKTPLRIGSEKALSTDFGDILVGLAQRAQAISPWIGLNYNPDLSRWRDIAKSTRFDGSEMQVTAWETWSTANGRDRAIGYIGRLRVVTPSDEVTALLAAGTVLHAGSMPSKGYGRYELYVEPW